MPGGIKDYEDEGNKIDQSDAIPTASRWRPAAIELEMIDLGASDVDGYDGDDGDDADVDEEEETLHTDDGLTPNMEVCGHSTRDCGHRPRECEDWTVYFRPVK